MVNFFIGSIFKMLSAIKLWLILLCQIVLISGQAFCQSSGQILSKEQFISPGNASKPLTWWHWINGNVTKSGIKKDLEDMKRVGIAGVQLFDTHMYLPKGPVRYGSDSWHDHVQYAIRICDSLGMEFYIANSPGWSGAGGPWISAAQSMKQLVYSETDIEGRPSEIQLQQPESRDRFYREIAVLAIPAGSVKKTEISQNAMQETVKSTDQDGIPAAQVIDLTKDFDPVTGKVKTKNLPRGKWTVLRFGYTTTAKKIHPAVDEGTGYEVDKLDPEAVTYQFNQSLGRIIKEAGSYTGKTFKGVLFDSFEGGFQNWTEKMPEMFLKHNGYDIRPFLPVLAGRTVKSESISSAFLWDFQQTLTDLFSENYYKTMQSLAHRHHLQVFSETQGGPMSPANGNKYVDVPMNEFWTDGIEKREPLIKQTVSIANVLGKNIVAAESFTSKPEFGKWQNLPEGLKKIGDYAFTTGINKFIFHTYTHQPYDVVPGFTMGRYGTHFGRTNTWWKYAPEWGHYLGRSQYLLQKGHIVSDICYLFPRDILYQYPAAMTKSLQGFNYDIIYPQYLGNFKVQAGQMTLPSGAKYRIMVLPDYPSMTLQTLRQLQQLLKEGAILAGPPPVRQPDMKGLMHDKAKFDQLVAELWGKMDGRERTEKTYGAGKLYWGKPIAEILDLNRVEPDIIFEPHYADSIRYIHRNEDNCDVYFILNRSAGAITSDVSFRIRGKQPEIWDAITGKVFDTSIKETVPGRTIVPLTLEPNGSAFVVFQRPALEGSEANILINTAQKLASEKRFETEISSEWGLRFLNGRGAPERLTMPTLQLWNTHADPNVKYYSGTVEYTNSFKIDKGIGKNDRVMLEFDELYDLAEVLVNDQSAGVIWKKPHTIDITAQVKHGLNNLKILVVNRWINRLIGDEFIPSGLKYDDAGSIFSRGKLLELPAWLSDRSVSRTDKRNTFTTWKHYDKNSSLVNSGLSGPVKVIIVK